MNQELDEIPFIIIAKQITTKRTQQTGQHVLVKELFIVNHCYPFETQIYS